jgi:SAM-dependent methyltransferase
LDHLDHRAEGLKDVVRHGYDEASYRYRPEPGDVDRFRHSAAEYEGWLGELYRRLPPGAEVLDLGCGIGVPVARRLSERFRVTGVELSPIQVARARRLAPKVEILEDDMTRVEFSAGRFSGVVAFYSIIHVPLREQPALFDRIARWLRPDGVLVATLGETAWEGIEEDWLGSGASMYWSHTDRPTYRAWLEERGLRVIEERFVPEENAGHALFVAVRAGGSG